MRILISTLILALGLLLCACPPADETTPETAEGAVEGHDHAGHDHSGHDHGAHGHGEAKDAHPWSVLHEDGVTRVAENMDNGVKMIFTSDCPHHQGLIKDGVAALIEHKNAKPEGEEGHKDCDCPMHTEGVTIASEAVEKGTAMIITTDNAELVPQLQESAKKKFEGKGCDCGGHGKHAEGHEGHDHGDKPCAGHKEGEDCGCDEDKKEPAAEEAAAE